MEVVGEVTTLKDEFKSIVDEILKYCKNKGYMGDNISYDIDAAAEEFSKIAGL